MEADLPIAEFGFPGPLRDKLVVATLGDPPVPINDDTLVVCVRFRVVERVQP